jgi:hypothetical protein
MKLASFILAALLFTGAVRAQDKLIESEIEYNVGTADGKTKFCSVDVTFAFMDNTYKRGGLAVVFASLAWADSRGKLGILLKVSGTDFDALRQPHPFHVNNAFLTLKSIPAPLSGTFQCENALAFCGGYSLPISQIIYDNLYRGDVSIGFNRQPGGLDIVFPISNSSDGAFDARKYAAFRLCMEELIERLSANAAK